MHHVLLLQVLASPADSAEATAQRQQQQPAPNLVLPPLANSQGEPQLFFSDGTPYRSVAELICASALKAAPPPADAVTPPSPLPPPTSPWDDYQPLVNEGLQSRPVSFSPRAPQPVLGDVAAVACEVDMPTPGTVPASADQLLQWERREYGDPAPSFGDGAEPSGGGGGGAAEVVGWLPASTSGLVQPAAGVPLDALALQVRLECGARPGAVQGALSWWWCWEGKATGCGWRNVARGHIAGAGGWRRRAGAALASGEPGVARAALVGAAGGAGRGQRAGPAGEGLRGGEGREGKGKVAGGAQLVALGVANVLGLQVRGCVEGRGGKGRERWLEGRSWWRWAWPTCWACR